MYNLGSTKENFKRWCCDICLTKLEHGKLLTWEEQMYMLVEQVGSLNKMFNLVHKCIVENHKNIIDILKD